MATTKWCINCRNELDGDDLGSLAFFGGSGSGIYCRNNKCPRYGLVTVIFLKSQEKAPEDAKPNDPLNEQEQS